MTIAHRLTFIGAGNMARSLVGGLLANGWPGSQITLADPSPDVSARYAGLDSELSFTSDNHLAASTADLIILAVKPQMLQVVCKDLSATLDKSQRPLIVSIAAGIRSDDIDRWLGGGFPVVRAMPNTPALVQSGATGLYANPAVSESQRALAESLMRAVGSVVWVDAEMELDAVTALSGSGPAYYFLVMEAMQAAGEMLGLSSETARLLTIETAFGAAKLALESGEPPANLRQNVTSKGGTTEKALASLEEDGIRELFARAMKAAKKRAEELSTELGKDE
ncbi:MAG: pyrroline-5-carboxylate reductase [Thiotrichales bacterium]